MNVIETVILNANSGPERLSIGIPRQQSQPDSDPPDSAYTSSIIQTDQKKKKEKRAKRN
jgi:hypothetical protein